MCRRAYPRNNLHSFHIYFDKKLIKNFWLNVLANFLNFLGTQGDKLIVMKYLGLINLGIYGRAYQVMSLPSTYLGKALDTVMFPYFSLNANTQESNGNKYLISYFSVVTFLFHFLLSSIIYLRRSRFIFSAKWIDASPVIQLLAISISAKIIRKINSALSIFR